MAPRRKRDVFKDWLSSLFAPKDETHYLRDGPGGFFGYAQSFAVNNSNMTSVQGNQYMYVQGDRNIVPQIMSLLSQHIIQGAAHDSSARTPPPRCHPDTRVKLIARITAWFHDQSLRELLLWITGPAGVGKSAIVQTFAEHLAKCECLGASIFISRPNKRNNPHGVFITIAYQLATRIEAYRNYIVERLSLDPELLRRDIQAQFTTFIIEPFVKKKVRAGDKRWCILLDGLDELQGEDVQCNIIQLISTFVRDYPDAPLLWIIASRPESRISNTFNDPEVHCNCRTEYIPIDSTEACEDVDRFLRSSFQTIQKNYRQSAPRDWPSNTDFLKLTAAASGLFIYAEVVMQFIRDPNHADPVSRLEILVSVIDRSTTIPTEGNPFVHLDALYHEILSSIPSVQWSKTKQLLGFAIHQGPIGTTFRDIQRCFRTLRGMSILFSINRHTIHVYLTKCLSILKIPDWKAAHKEELTFLHASFADYLKDPSRSRDFHVGDSEDVEEGVVLRLLETWNRCSGDDIAIASVESMWHQYCSKWDDKPPSKVVAKFHATLFRNFVYCLRRVVYNSLERPVQSLIYIQLCRVHMAKLCYYFDSEDLSWFVLSLNVPPGFNDTRLYRETQLRNLEFGHLDWKEMSPAHSHNGRRGKLNRPHSSTELRAFVSELEFLREHSPNIGVIIFGGVPQWRVAAFRHTEEERIVYYVIPYPV